MTEPIRTDAQRIVEIEHALRIGAGVYTGELTNELERLREHVSTAPTIHESDRAAAREIMANENRIYQYEEALESIAAIIAKHHAEERQRMRRLEKALQTLEPMVNGHMLDIVDEGLWKR